MTFHLSRRGSTVALALALALAALWPGLAAAQAWPDKPLRIMVGASPGGGTDILVRLLAEKMGPALKQTITVENRPGASNTIAAEMTAKAAPDGHTLLLATNTGQAVAPYLIKLKFDPLKDLQPIGLVAVVPNVLVVGVNSPYKRVKELLADMQSEPGALKYASSGIGSTQHIVGEAFNLSTRTRAIHVPYKGSTLPLTEVSAPDAAVPAGRIAWWRHDSLGGREPALGESSAAAGRCMMRSLELACEAVQRGAAQAIVFAPFNKHSLRLGGLQQEDELRYLADRFDVPGFVCEFNITGELWTSRVTSHAPLREVADQIEVIAPAVQSLRAEGLDARGPYSPDTVFVAARRGDYDAVVSMYHDQGQIAMKLLGFERGVTLHGGLPVPVTTSAIGSAFDIAGQGIARVEGLRAAFELALKMAGTAR